MEEYKGDVLKELTTVLRNEVNEVSEAKRIKEHHETILEEFQIKKKETEIALNNCILAKKTLEMQLETIRAELVIKTLDEIRLKQLIDINEAKAKEMRLSQKNDRLCHDNSTVTS